eukprot:COSAG06_NODE_1602_length_8958_cov_85.920194_6_plen_84_part_00
MAPDASGRGFGSSLACHPLYTLASYAICLFGCHRAIAFFPHSILLNVGVKMMSFQIMDFRMTGRRVPWPGVVAGGSRHMVHEC